jgi:hypothetical protein
MGKEQEQGLGGYIAHRALCVSWKLLCLVEDSGNLHLVLRKLLLLRRQSPFASEDVYLSVLRSWKEEASRKMIAPA